MLDHLQAAADDVYKPHDRTGTLRGVRRLILVSSRDRPAVHREAAGLCHGSRSWFLVPVPTLSDAARVQMSDHTGQTVGIAGNFDTDAAPISRRPVFQPGRVTPLVRTVLAGSQGLDNIAVRVASWHRHPTTVRRIAPLLVVDRSVSPVPYGHDHHHQRLFHREAVRHM